MTFPRSLEQLPRSRLDGFPEQRNARISVDYNIEGAPVGYKWFEHKRLEPLFPFGRGLSYTSFERSSLGAAVKGKQLSVRFTVKNTGERAGKYVAQQMPVYLRFLRRARLVQDQAWALLVRAVP